MTLAYIIAALIVIAFIALILHLAKGTPYNQQPSYLSQIQESHYTPKTKRLIIYYKQIPGNPHYSEYYFDSGTWKKLPSFNEVDKTTNDILTDILVNIHKGRGGSKSFTK